MHYIYALGTGQAISVSKLKRHLFQFSLPQNLKCALKRRKIHSYENKGSVEPLRFDPKIESLFKWSRYLLPQLSTLGTETDKVKVFAT